MVGRPGGHGVSDPAVEPEGDGPNGHLRRAHTGVAHEGVAAHGLLNSSSVVCMGISTLLRLWEHLPGPERQHLLQQMAAHAAAVDDGLKLLTLGHDGARP
jgi:hypothetical protein